MSLSSTPVAAAGPPTSRPRLTLADLDGPKRLLIATVLLTLALGYLAALANLFATNSAADGKATVTLDDFPSVYREKGLIGLACEVQKSLGIEDVVRRYHGTGAGVTRLETSLKGVMRPIMTEELASKDTPLEETEKEVDMLFRPLIAWSKLPADLRKRAYEKGVPLRDDGEVDFERFIAAFGNGALANKSAREGLELVPVIKDTFADHCISCHSASGTAAKIPLVSYAEIDAYCGEDRGIPPRQLAMTTHVHALGFCVLFAMSGFIFSMTRYHWLVRATFSPWTLLFQMIELACWWLAKLHVGFAYAIFYLGVLVGVGLGVQIFGSLIDLAIGCCRSSKSVE
jgi:hypothetical protein